MEGLLDAADHLDARQFQNAVKRLADSLGYGADRSPFLGSGIEYHLYTPRILSVYCIVNRGLAVGNEYVGIRACREKHIQKCMPDSGSFPLL